MSKYKPKVYAKSLVDSLLDKKSSADGKKIISNFLRILERNGEMRKSREIIYLAEKLFLKKTGNKKIILETARKIDGKHLMGDFIKKGDIVEKKISPEIVSGVKIIFNNEKQLDFSLSKKLNDIFI